MQTRNDKRNKDKDRRANPYMKSKKKHWSENIKWKYLPGAVCSACGQNNHEIYETGCPAMAIFCNCQKFFNKSKPEHLKPVIEQFAKFKEEQRNKQMKRRREMKKTLNKLKDCGDEAKIRKVFVNQYFEEFPEEQLLHDDIDFYENSSDSESSDSSKICEEV